MLTSKHCFLSFLLASAAVAQGEGEASLKRSFGEPGREGSFYARFVRAGAGLDYLLLTDHAKSVDKPKPDAKPGDNHLLLVWNGSDHALRLAHASAAAPAVFPVDPAEADWRMVSEGDAVTFTLDGGKGLEFEKVLRHEQRQRGFVLELALRNEDSDATGSLDLVLGGPMPVSPAESSFFG